MKKDRGKKKKCDFIVKVIFEVIKKNLNLKETFTFDSYYNHLKLIPLHFLILTK